MKSCIYVISILLRSIKVLSVVHGFSFGKNRKLILFAPRLQVSYITAPHSEKLSSFLTLEKTMKLQKCYFKCLKNLYRRFLHLGCLISFLIAEVPQWLLLLWELVPPVFCLYLEWEHRLGVALVILMWASTNSQTVIHVDSSTYIKSRFNCIPIRLSVLSLTCRIIPGEGTAINLPHSPVLSTTSLLFPLKLRSKSIFCSVISMGQ